MYKLAVEHFKPTPILPYKKSGCEQTIFDVVKGGKSDYKIVIPRTPSQCERFSAEELQKYIQQATDARLEIVIESENVVLGEKWLAIGKTALASGLDTTNLNLDGFRIKTEDKTVLIKGERERGTLYGVYDFLEKFLCVRFVSTDFEYVPKTETLSLFALDIKEIPAFKLRCHHVQSMHDCAMAVKRRFVSPMVIKTVDDEKFGGMLYQDLSDDMHTYKNLIPYAVYGEEHPEWFSLPKQTPTGKLLWQPAWSNGLNDDGTIDASLENSLIKEVIKNVKQIILTRPDILYVAMGQNDNHNISMRENCVRQRALFGGHGGHQIVFVNAVAKEIKKWMAEQKIERELSFLVYAYLETHKPPVKISANGEIVPFCHLSIPREDVIVHVAPYEASYNEPLSVNSLNDFNFIYATELLGWAKLCKQIFIFDYDVNFSDKPMWFPNTEIITKNVRYYREIGATGIMTNGSGGDTHYQSVLHTYIFSKLYWNLDLDIESLISEFNYLYFGAEAGYMVDRLIKYIRNRFESVSVENGYKKPAQIFSEASPWMVSPTTWDVNFITECERLIDGAKWHVKTRSNYDEETKAVYFKHLAKLEFMICYAKWKNYDLLFAPTDKEKFMEKFRKVYETAQVRDFKVSINSSLTMHEILNIKEDENNESN